MVFRSVCRARQWVNTGISISGLQPKIRFIRRKLEMTSKKETPIRIDCRKCHHYFVTWEPAQPHGCRAMGFKCHLIPSAVVYQNSGCECRAYLAGHRKSSSTNKA